MMPPGSSTGHTATINGEMGTYIAAIAPLEEWDTGV